MNNTELSGSQPKNESISGIVQFRFIPEGADENMEFPPTRLQVQLSFGDACQLLKKITNQLWASAIRERERGPRADINILIFGRMEIKTTDS